MGRNIKTEKLNIGGMTCVSCGNKIEKKLRYTAGIKTVQVSYNDATVQVTFDGDVIRKEDIVRIIEKLDYQVLHDTKQESGHSKVLGAIIIVFAIYMILRHFGLTNLFHAFPEAEEGMGYGVLFFIGLFTSVHCVAMCGGINLSQCIAPSATEHGKSSRFAALRSSILYNLGRVISYTFLGGVVGALGSVVSFSENAKGMIQIVAGVFMVIMGLNMLNLFPWLRRLSPRIPKIFATKIKEQKSSKSPLYVGLLNGLMPCGPLQAMQLYALSTGDPVKGALSMFLFSLGTVPLMFGLGALSSILSQKFTKHVRSVGAVLVVLLGISMFQSGASLSGISSVAVKTDATEQVTQIQDDVQLVTTNLNSGRYQPITVKAGIPVRWTVTVEKGTINGCNRRMLIPEYGVEKTFEVGDNVIEFTPTETGVFPYSCWMGMIRSTVTVTE